MLGRSSSSPVGVAVALRGDAGGSGFPADRMRGSGGGRRGCGGGPAVCEDEEGEEEDLEAGYQVDGEEDDSEDEEEGAGGKRGRAAPGCRRRAQGGGTAAGGGGLGSGWAIYVVLFVFQLTVPSILWSYGVLMTWMIESGDVQLPIALWTPALFSATYCLADPWVRWPATRGSSGRRTKVSAPWVLRPLAVAGILITTISLFVTPFFPTRDYCLLTYGMLAGLGCSMTVAQSELSLDQRFPPRKRRYRKRVLSLAIIRIACSISQITSPLILMGLINTFGRRYAPMLQSGIVLQALVAALLLRQKRMDASRRDVKLAKIRYSIMEEEDAGSWNCGGLAMAAPEGENLLPFEEDLAGRSWKNPARDDSTAFDARDDDEDLSSDEPMEQPPPDAVTSLLQQPRLKNCYGVEILPQIPEESEDEDSRDAGGETWQGKRLSRRLTLTIPTTNINNNINNNNDNGKGPPQPPPSDSPTSQNSPLYPNGNNVYSPDTPTSTSSTTRLITPNGGAPTKWKRWKWKRRKWRGGRRRRSRTVSGGSSCCDEDEDDADGEDQEGQRSWRRELGRVVSWRGLTKASFYPSLALSASTRLAGMAFFTLLPLVARRMGRSSNDATLLVAIAGFSSLLVSLASPFISYPTSRKKGGKDMFEPRCCKKFVYSAGSIASALAFFLLSRAEWYGKLTMAAILFGIGSGATADTSSSLLRTASAGGTSIDGSRGLMCTLTAFIILGCTALLDIYTGRSPVENTIGSHITTLPGATSLSICFSVIAIIQFLAGIAWCIQPVLSRFYRRQRHFAGWSPGMFLQTA